ncbi:GGDEF domain-containing protein [Bosea sp. BK604]|uniref:GGDEF domain-containing protein n=1 Tax=Bosea sp. BK604 TaxID=2512180 RepID=UPI00104D33CA|nr:GGDEF domain-containing protein [Bosea sp. BK604]TCR63636.1 diguanylate cyclase (GGDEF)-like protein [Bosea sp. BK604]
MPNLLISPLNLLRSSLLSQAFASCFVATHVPIVFFLAYVAAGGEISSQAVLIVILLATILGTAISFLLMRHLLAPLSHVVTELRAYRTEARRPEFEIVRNDEIGKLMAEVGSLIGSLEDKLSRLRRQAHTDALTGLGNRRWLSEVVNAEIAKSRRSKQPLSVIAFDLDHFKKVNDEFGHDVGDEVLVAVAAVARETLRSYDLIARLGGEEFCAFLPGCDIASAAATAERMREAIAAVRLDKMGGRGFTSSFGVHEADLQRQRFRDMLKCADEHLYAAKNMGRNRVSLQPMPEAVGPA